MTERYAEFSSLQITRPEDGILEIVMSTPGKLNAAGHEMHRDLAYIWDVIDQDPDTRVVVVRGEGKAFSSGGDLDLEGGARPRLQPDQLLQTDRLGDAGPGGRRRSGGRAARRRVDCRPLGPHHRRPHTAWRRRRRPCGDRVAAAVRHGQGEISPAVVRAGQRRGGRAHRARVAVRRRRRPARQGARGGAEARQRFPERGALDEIRPQQLAAHGRARASTPRWRSSSWASTAPTCRRGSTRSASTTSSGARTEEDPQRR
jgi:hypothetical protein